MSWPRACRSHHLGGETRGAHLATTAVSYLLQRALEGALDCLPVFDTGTPQVSTVYAQQII